MRIVRFLNETDSAARPTWGVLDENQVRPLAGEPWPDAGGNAAAAGDPLPLEACVLLAPVDPSKIVCVGRNYAAHAAELGNEVPAEPLLFLKPPSAIIAPGDDVVYPSISRRVDYEAEIAVVMGRRCRFVSEQDALDHVFGYTVANDVTARDLQKSDEQWSRAKGFDTFLPVGPWVETEFDPAGRTVRCTVNGEQRQNGNTSNMIFSIARIISHISQAMTLEPGDLILTGTPDGIGPVQPGDVMTVEVEGLGAIANPVVSEADYRARLGL